MAEPLLATAEAVPIEDIAIATPVPVVEGVVFPGMGEFAASPVHDKYEVLGDDMQVLHLKLSPAEVITTEPGTMAYMDPALKGGADFGNCPARCISGNPPIMATYTNGGEGDAVIGVTSNTPAKIIPLELDGAVTYQCKSGSFVASQGDVKLNFDLDCDPSTACCGGQGCVRQTVTGTGVAFLGAMGTIMVKTLSDGERIDVDTYSAIAWDKNVTLGIALAGGPCAACCGGEGLFNTTLTGPGTVYLQSMSVEKFRASIKQAAIAQGLGAAGAPPSGQEMER